MKRLLLTLALLPSQALAAFNDVTSTHPNEQAINYLADQQIIEGYGDGTFRPETGINRAEFAKIVVGSRFSPDQITRCVGNGNLRDVTPTDWFRPYVCVAQAENIIEGYSDGTFGAANPITLAEAAKVVVESFERPPTPGLSPWYAPYLDRLKKDKAVPDSVLEPGQPLNRGEMAELIYRLMINTANTPAPEIIVQPGTEKIKADDFNNDQSQTILALTNEARAANGAPPLTLDPELSQIAQEYAQRMDAEDFFDHVDPQGTNPGQRLTQAGYSWRYVGENIAKGQVSADYAFDTWKTSSGHWANILNPNYESIGIGQYKVTDDRYYKGYIWVQVFGTKK